MVSIGTSFVSSTFSRATTNLSRNVILANLRRTQKEILRSQEQLSTGLRILKPSDDPIGANRIADFQIRIDKSDQFLRNIESATGRLNISDSSMDGVNEMVNKARTILLEHVQSTSSADSRRFAAQEVEQLLQQAVNMANTSFDGRYIFAGRKSENPPLAFVGGGVAYVGDNNSFNTNVSEGLSLATNVSADEAFGVFSDEILGLDLGTLQTIDLNPAVRTYTKVSTLREGQGVSLGSVSITGSGTAVIDLSIADNVGDIIDLINAETATTGITASINAADNGFLLTRSGGGTIVVDEVSGGTTASNLGIYTGSGGSVSPLTGSDLNPTVTKATQLGDLYGGAGITSSGITITNATATATFTTTLDSTVFTPTATVEQLLNAINGANVYADARINEDGTGIDVFSRLSGGRLTISEATGSGTTASELGLLSTLARAKLSDLNNGNGVDSVDGADFRIVRKDGTAVYIDVDNAERLQDVVDAIDSDTLLSAVLMPSGYIQITDTSSGAGDLRVENFNGSFAATNLGIEGSTPNAPGPITFSGTSLTFVGVQVEGIFTALINLRDGLLSNDTNKITRSQRLFDIAQSKILGARSSNGARLAGLELTKNRLDSQKLELSKLMSDIRDVDFAEAATRMQLQMNILQAGLATAARILQTSILDYL